MQGLRSVTPLKKVGKIALVIFGILFVVVQLLAFSGYIEVNWGRIEEQIDPLVQPEALNGFWQRLVSILTYNITFAAAFIPSMILGFKRG